jgi:hypothetical protein
MLALTGCDEQKKPAPPQLEKTVASSPEQATSSRFLVESHGTFHAGYDDNRREILIITDTETGVQYLSITGCGTTEMRSEKSGKSTVTRER